MFKTSIYIFITCALFSCKKLVEVGIPRTRLDSDRVYNSDATAAAALTGIYHKMSVGGLATGVNSISLRAGLSADEFDLYPNVDNFLIQHYTNHLDNTNGTFWNELYNYIYSANAAIEGIAASPALTGVVKNQLLGEAKFIRAFCYYYLINFYGDVPLILGTDYRVNALASRASATEVYTQIINDLNEAKNLLGTDYVANDAFSPSPERVRPNKAAAAALLARVYLFKGDWAAAETEATFIIDQTSFYDTVSLGSSFSNVFEKNSAESIWQLMPVNTGRNTEDAPVFVITEFGPGFGNPVFLSDHLLNSFEPADQRKSNWIKSVTVGTEIFYFPYKYKISDYGQPVTEYLTVFRLAEQYLIRAEARVQQDNISGAQDDLNVIRKRASLPASTGNDRLQLLTAVLHERRSELFSEWGHRWLDLKRTGNVDAVMEVVTPEKGGVWNTHWQWYPLPLTDLRANPNLYQNKDY